MGRGGGVEALGKEGALEEDWVGGPFFYYHL